MPTTVRKKKDLKTVSPVEAAWLTELSAKTINATIDRGEVKCASRKRTLGVPEILYLALRKEIGEALSSDGKRELYSSLRKPQFSDWASCLKQASRDPELEVLFGGGRLRVGVRSACLRLAKRFKALNEAVDEVVEDPDIRSGEPIVRGTRIPVYMIGDLLSQGADPKEILEDYPAINASKFRAVLAYLETHPKRGRPRQTLWKQDRKSRQAGLEKQ